MMSRQDRRRVERELKKIPKGDNCTICGKEFPHNSRTFGGATADGTTVFAGECCARQVVTVIGSGVYLSRGTDVLSPLVGKGTGKGITPGNVEHAISAIQSHFNELDNQSNALMRQGGMQVPAKNIFRADSAWKADDAAWFKAHPDRSHRLRPMLEGEAETLPVEITKAEIPANHELEILVRQVAPGARIRTVFCRNAEIAIPDQEEIIHAIFDTVAKAGQRGIIDAREINERAKQYVAGRAQLLN